MESELSGIFRVKLVTKNIERGSPGTELMHMKVNSQFYKQIDGVAMGGLATSTTAEVYI